MSEAVTSETESARGTQATGQGSSVSFPDAQRLISLFFALCVKVSSSIKVGNCTRIGSFWHTILIMAYCSADTCL